MAHWPLTILSVSCWVLAVVLKELRVACLPKPNGCFSCSQTSPHAVLPHGCILIVFIQNSLSRRRLLDAGTHIEWENNACGDQDEHPPCK
jgi:hypothetical protein